MKNVVTPETARKLKEAGFKQPEPAPGQMWYNVNDIPIFVVGETKSKVYYVIFGVNLVYIEPKRDFVLNLVFAPTATDILRELGNQYVLRTWSIGEKFAVKHDNGEKCWNDNPAEAAALAWLEKYAK